MTKKLTTEEFISRANVVHNNKYVYDDAIYTNAITKIKIGCKEHGIFEQTPSCHLQGQGCKKCYHDSKTSSKEEFIQKSNIVHNNNYCYDDAIYKNNRIKIKINCKEHGIFYQTPNAHLNGRGCPKCNIGGMSKEKFLEIGKDKECTFYLINCYNDNESFYKIGITTLIIKRRFNNKESMPYNYTILKEIKADAETIWNIEYTLKENLKSSYTPCIHFNGSFGECFSDLKEIENNLINML